MKHPELTTNEALQSEMDGYIAELGLLWDKISDGDWNVDVDLDGGAGVLYVTKNSPSDTDKVDLIPSYAGPIKEQYRAIFIPENSEQNNKVIITDDKYLGWKFIAVQGEGVSTALHLFAEEQTQPVDMSLLVGRVKELKDSLAQGIVNLA